MTYSVSINESGRIIDLYGHGTDLDPSVPKYPITDEAADVLRKESVLANWRYASGAIQHDPLPVAPVVPPEVSPFQARAALLQAGLLAMVEAYMALPDTPPMTKLAWEQATVFRRASPLVISLGALLGLTETQLDDLFIVADTIKV